MFRIHRHAPPRSVASRVPVGAEFRPRRVRRGGFLCIVAALLAVSTSEVDAGRIEGTIRFEGLQASSPRLSPYAGRLGGEAGEAAPPPPSVGEIALYLADLRPRPAAADTLPRPQLRQVSVRFDPRVLAIPVGTTVDFPNLDPVFHNVFSYSPAKRFDLGRYGKNKSKAVRFDTPGLVKVFCDVHASMSAYILVVDTSFVVQPDPSGNFAIDGVPEGHHRMTVWHPDRGEQVLEIEVGNGTTHVEIGF